MKIKEVILKLERMVESNNGACFDDLTYDESAVKKAILFLKEDLKSK